MGPITKWKREQITCPEGRGQAELLAEWRVEGEEAALTGMSCQNPQLRDLSGEDCQWSCWERVEKASPDRES